ncbi:MAG: type I DNA topoisomerase [Anaerovibrio sp.]|nr:type I DNA topoisomerase [Selenomonadaceae bacterium]MDY6052507.1 type I DNA topoisomerase [Anaerovibrio sp.]
MSKAQNESNIDDLQEEKKTAARKSSVKKPAKKAAAKKTAAKKTASKAKKKQGYKLVLVESPTKAKTIERYLGKGFVVRASMGHLRDLPKSQFGIDVENNFEPKYINIRGKGDLIKSLKKEASKADKVYLASDPDREGEAIAWHLAHIFDIDVADKSRIVFNEITKPAIQSAVKEPRAINIDMVDAQQARRMLDRIVGYKLSPLLWRKVRKGLSAGRVQSVTVKLICDREKAIEAFESKEYWTVDLKFKKDKSPQFNADLTHVDGKKLDVDNGRDAEAIAKDVENGKWLVQEVKKRQRSKKAMAPFTTSSLQQDAARKLGFTSRRTMMVAQQLYEGIELGSKGPTGLITYMRTDSTRISELAQAEAKSYILDKFGDAYYPAKANIYASGKKAQDAHEAIRPTSVMLAPETIERHLSADQQKLYRLIWQRFVSSQMVPAVFDTVNAKLKNGRYTASASGSHLIFPGFQAVYVTAEGEEKDVALPELVTGDELRLMKVLPKQHFTEPPPRYNDASLVKVLEEKGIGRPSTYAPIIETVLARGYVARVSKTFKPTELGFVVVDMLEEYFKDIVDEKFTANMEAQLDSVAGGNIDKNEVLKEFYEPFAQTLAKADEAIGHVELPVEVSDVPCDICGRMMVVKQGRFGKFLACPGFPDCRNTKPLLKDTGIKCPKCDGTIVERKSRRGRNFFGCKNYPQCDFVTWDVPQAEKCPKCGSLQLKHFYRNGRGLLYCINDDCETRVDHPINKELEKQRAKAEKEKEALAVAEDRGKNE